MVSGILSFDFMIKNFKLVIVAILAIALIVPLAMTRASALTNAKDTLSTVKASTVANHEIYFVSPAGIALNANVAITFTDFTTTGVAFGDVDIATSTATSDCANGSYTEQTVAASAAASTWGVSNSNPTITFSAPTSGTGALAAGKCIRIRIGTNASTGGAGTNQITNAATGLRSLSIAGSFGDTGSISIYIVDNDQVTVNATVPQALTFSLSSTTIGFGTLSTTQVKFANNSNTGTTTPSAAHNVQVSTNSAGGYVVTVKGATLTYGTSTIDAIGASNTAIATGTEQFGVRFDASGGSGTVTAPYADTGFAYAADATTTSQIASSAGASNNTTYSATYVANIAGLTEAGTYTATLTYVGTATY